MPSSPLSDRAAELRQRLIRHAPQAVADGSPLAQHLQRPPRYDTRYASLSDGTAARKLGCSVDVLAAGHQGCPYHFHHAQEELFVILSGQGSLRVAGELLPVQAGDVIFIPPGPEYPHQLLNTSDAPLTFLSISTQDKPEICEYPDSGKAMAWAPGVKLLQRPADALDYWDGEP